MMVGYKVLLDLVQEEFDELLAAKPTWGKNEIRLLLEQAKTAALLRLLS